MRHNSRQVRYGGPCGRWLRRPEGVMGSRPVVAPAGGPAVTALRIGGPNRWLGLRYDIHQYETQYRLSR